MFIIEKFACQVIFLLELYCKYLVLSKKRSANFSYTANIRLFSSLLHVIMLSLNKICINLKGGESKVNMRNPNIRISYEEHKYRTLSIFRKIITDASTGEIILIKNVTCPLKKVEENGFTYFILYNDSMQPIRDAFEYLNYDLRNTPFTSRSKAAFSLSLLYCFLSLSACDIKHIDYSVFNQLQMFLQGLGVNDSGSLKTTRSANTINSYFATYRNYFRKRRIHCEPLFATKKIRHEFCLPEMDIPQSQDQISYSSNLKAKRPNVDTTPKYIGPNDFRKLYKLALRNNDKEAQVLMHLMYGYGLRLGECLGLTTEDIQEIRIDGEYVPVIFIRNRLSDKRFQFAKGLQHPISKEQYHSKDYTASRHRIIITYDFYEFLIDYINEAHGAAMEKYPANYEAGAADIVSYRDKPDFNHYVFLNRYGKILSDQTWNNKLRRYFVEAGIPIDAEFRENNLSHRFRHGFAMFHARFSEHPVNVLELQKMMRHKSISSTMVYYNPTPEDELEIKTAFQTELYDMIPELKEGWGNVKNRNNG